jgi:hypothetical protein
MQRPFPSGLICLLTIVPRCVPADQPNRLNAEERAQGFRLLFDGKSLDGWRNYRSETTRPQWQVVDGSLVLTAKGGRDLVTRDTFVHFDLRLDYALAEQGNSGILFRVVEDSEERHPVGYQN